LQFISGQGICSTGSLTFTINASNDTNSWNHYWEGCVGSGHALLALRSDYQRLMTQVHNDLGFNSVRFHGIFDDDLSVVLYGTYSFFNIDEIYDFLLSIGMKPYVELSFMPDELASGNQTIFHYDANVTPPKSFPAWGWLVGNFTQHLVQRYGLAEVQQWNFEVWNEPNLGFWDGTQAQYFELYQVSANAIKAISPTLRVGGPASSNSTWLPEFLNFVETNSIPADFISTHQYPTDYTPTLRNTLYTALSKARQEVPSSYPLYYSEYNDGLYGDPSYHDYPYSAAFIIKNVHDVSTLNIDILSWWTFSDIFEEDGFWSFPFYGNDQWGLIDIYGIPKPDYRAFQLLHESGDTEVYVTPNTSFYPTVGTYAIKNSTTNELLIFIFNENVPNGAIQNETVCITVSGVSTKQPAVLRRIDTDNCNAPLAWTNMGSPAYPTQVQIQQLVQVSQFVQNQLTYTIINAETLQFEIEIPAQAVAVVTLAAT